MNKLNLIWSSCRLGFPPLVSKYYILGILRYIIPQLKLWRFKEFANSHEEFCSSLASVVNTAPREDSGWCWSRGNCISVNISNIEDMSRLLKASHNCFTVLTFFPSSSSSFVIVYCLLISFSKFIRSIMAFRCLEVTFFIVHLSKLAIPPQKQRCCVVM